MNKFNNIYKHRTKFIIAFISLFAAFLLLSYRLEEVPMGLSVDESSIGYNATLISKTLHDQNGRLLPFFVLTINGQDWKQPVTIYTTATIFKLISPSLYSLRLVSVLVALFSLCLIYLLVSRLVNPSIGYVAGFIFLTIPMITIHSHLAQENIMPLPFVLIWLISLLYFWKNQRWRYLILAGISLGIGFYSYKSMRLIVPIWSVLTCIYLILTEYQKKKYLSLLLFKPALIFTLSILPFFAITPWLEFKYAGAVFDNKQTNFRNYYDFFFPYLSSFDPAYLFIKGDITIWHSTDRHGMFLLPTLPLFIIGCYQAWRKKGFWLLILMSFFTAPLLFGFVDSVHRFSRLLAIIPSFVALCSLAIYSLWQNKNKLSMAVLIFILISNILIYHDFINYYWYDYAKLSRPAFSPGVDPTYRQLAKISKKFELTPFIESSIYINDRENAQFFEVAYFEKPLKHWQAEEPLPPDSILMTQLEAQPGLKKIDLNLPFYNFMINENQILKVK